MLHIFFSVYETVTLRRSKSIATIKADKMLHFGLKHEYYIGGFIQNRKNIRFAYQMPVALILKKVLLKYKNHNLSFLNYTETEPSRIK